MCEYFTLACQLHHILLPYHYHETGSDQRQQSLYVVTGIYTNDKYVVHTRGDAYS